MKIKKVILENIRSYEKETIEFKSGITLLSGDIGSGKSTVLLAMEFAFFGLVKGKINSDGLLRNGKKQGSVSLFFEINNEEVIIKRNLKKSSKSIKQETGFLTINGVEQELTPTEIRAKIIDLLGYPKEFVTKSPSAIFRFTVYTPQEDIKLILSESPESRVEIIRKIFNIDKYKLIKNNVSLYVKEINARIREDKAKTEDLEDLRKEKNEIKEGIKELNVKFKKINTEKSKQEKIVNEKVKEINKYDELIIEQNKLKQKIAVKKSNLKSLTEQEKSNLENINKLKQEIESMKDPKLFDVTELKERLKKNKENKIKLDQKKKEYFEKKAVVNSRIKNKTDLINKVTSLDVCPTCKQTVKEEHKLRIKQEEKEKIDKDEANIKKINKAQCLIDQKIAITDKNIDKINKLLNENELIKLKIKTKKEKIERKTVQEKELQNIKEKISETQKSLDVNLKNINKKIEEEYKDLKKKFDQEKTRLKDIEIKQSAIEKEIKLTEERNQRLDKKIKNKQNILDKIKTNKKITEWINSLFLNLMESIEKRVLHKILIDFNEHFQHWFNALIEDENLSVRLDDSFTPIIEQNGYENDVNNLSGGEKTSVALAYRLALNKVINDFVSGIKTKSLLILDEPTDGFSSTQLDKLRDVLMEINSEQIILVSHESKLESYANNLIKINKENHKSSIINY